MSGKFTLVMKDGSRSEVSGDVKFKVVNGQKLLTGFLETDDRMHEIYTNGPAYLDMSGNHHWFNVEKIDYRGSMIVGIMPPS